MAKQRRNPQDATASVVSAARKRADRALAARITRVDRRVSNLAESVDSICVLMRAHGLLDMPRAKKARR